MLKLTRRQKILLYITAGAVGVFLIERLFLAGLRSKIKELQLQTRKEEANLKIGTEIQKRKDNVLKDYQDFKDFLRKAEIPDKEVFSGFLKQIEKIAQESGLSILNLTPQSEAVSAKAYKKYNAELRAETSLENLFNFLQKLQNNAMLIKLDKFSLTAKDEQATILKLDGTLSISIPY